MGRTCVECSYSGTDCDFVTVPEEDGYYDLCVHGPAYLRFRLTLMEQNGAAASFFLKLAETIKERRYRKAALWALSAFTGDFSRYGIHAAGFGQALADFVNR